MTLQWKKVESANRPPDEVDTESSMTTVYLYRNITEKQRTDEESGATYTYFEYDMSKLSRSDYGIYLAEKNAADTEYLAMMADIDMEEG